LSLLLALVAIGWFAGRSWLDSYLRSPEFRRFIGERIGKTLKAEDEVAPLAFTGLNVYTDGVKAKGFEGSPFSDAAVENIRMRFSLRRFFDKVWQQLCSGQPWRAASTVAAISVG